VEINNDVLILVGFIALSLSLYFYLKKRNSNKSVSSTDLDRDQLEAVQSVSSTDLDRDQLEAVQTRYDVPLLVIAGPGSGKTRVIVERVKDMVIRQNVDPEKILCLTFSKAAQETMQKRLRDDEDLKKNKKFFPLANIRTYHSLCKEFLGAEKIFQKSYNNENSGIDDEQEFHPHFEDLLKYIKLHPQQFSFQHFGNKPPEIMELTDGVSAFKRENRTFHDLDEYLRTQNSPVDEYYEKLKDLSKYFKEYQKYLNLKRLYDWDDLLQKTITQKEIIEFLQRYQQNIEHVLIDEFQDNNYLQFEIAKRLTPKGHITVVGDPNQTIYSFQGANIETFAEFKRTYKNHKTVKLRNNYRSTPQIVNVSNALLKNTELTTKNPTGDKVKILEFPNKKSEYDYIKNYISQKIGTEFPQRSSDKLSQLKLSDIVVIVRTNRERLNITHYLRSNNIPIISNGKVWKHKSISLSIEQFSQINNLTRKSTVQELIKILSDYSENSTLLLVVREFEKAKPNSKIGEIIDYFLNPPDGNTDKLKIGIEISTAHRTKGKEFRVVIIMNSIQTHFPLNFKKRELRVPENLRRYKSDFDEKTIHDKEERRLYYVAITRAMYELVITYSVENTDQQNTEKSSYLSEIDFSPDVDFKKSSE